MLFRILFVFQIICSLSFAGPFKQKHEELSQARLPNALIVESLFQEAARLAPRMDRGDVHHDIAVLFYMARRHIEVPADLLADVLDAIPLNRAEPETQKSWCSRFCNGLAQLIPTFGSSGPLVTFNHGGSREMVDAFMSGRSRGYAQEAQGRGIFVTPLSSSAGYAGRAELYAMRTPIKFFGTPCIASGKISQSCLRTVNHNSGYERVIMPDDAQRITELQINELDLRNFELVQHYIQDFYVSPLRLRNSPFQERIRALQRQIAELFGHGHFFR